jgi:hypothetical protein
VRLGAAVAILAFVANGLLGLDLLAVLLSLSLISLAINRPRRSER